MRPYVNVLNHALQSGHKIKGRNGATRAIFGASCQVDTLCNFPLLSLRKLNFNNVLHEVIWYLRGEEHVEYLHANGVHIWDQWLDKDGRLGPVYGVQWRRWGSNNIDQIKQVETELEASINGSEYSRRLLVSAWNVADLPDMRLPPCPFAFQLHLSPVPTHLDRQYRADLHMTVYQRSCDLFVGLPHDIAGHALLLRMFAEAHGCRARTLTMQLGDAHLYEEHVEAAEELIERALRFHQTCGLDVRNAPPRASVLEFVAEDFSLRGYRPASPLKVEVKP